MMCAHRTSPTSSLRWTASVRKPVPGYYDYEPGNRTPIPSQITADLIQKAAEKFGIEQRQISEEEIIERCFYSMFNIGCDILE